MMAGGSIKSGRALKSVVKWPALPVRDFFAALEACLVDRRPLCVFAILFSAVLSWWVYVPLHELLHALGCVMAGGRVERLEISGIYGASLLKKAFPFIAVGSDYSGRLTGFDTGGSDVTFFVTDFMPYVLTIFFGVPLIKSIPSLKSSSLFKSICFGIAGPFAYAPFMSVFGDYYEMGSILVSRPASSGLTAVNADRWRSDDLFRLVDKLSASQTVPRAFDAAVVISSLLVGVILLLATYWGGALFSRALAGRKKGSPS
ncbi:MAG: hypothetical protein P8013_09170 [Candidatus Sulfobium sp.]|jgi:hypothetical protein